MPSIIPRILGQTTVSTANSSTRSLDISYYSNDGDYVMQIDSILIDPSNSSVSEIDEPTILIKPTNAPIWMRRPVAMSVLTNLVNDINKTSSVLPSIWQLESPIFLGPRDGFDIQIQTSTGTTTGISFIGKKLVGVTEVPKFRSPRILFSQIPTLFGGTLVSGNATATLDIEDLRNYGDRPMHLYRAEIQTAGGQNAGVTTPITSDQLRFRIASSKYGTWMGKNQRIAWDSVNNNLMGQIFLGDILIDPDEAFIVEVLNNQSSTAVIRCAMIGAVDL